MTVVNRRTVEIDFNVRARGGLTRAQFDAGSPVVAGDEVIARDSDEDLEADALVVEVELDPADPTLRRGLIFLEVDRATVRSASTRIYGRPIQ